MCFFQQFSSNGEINLFLIEYLVEMIYINLVDSLRKWWFGSKKDWKVCINCHKMETLNLFNSLRSISRLNYSFTISVNHYKIDEKNLKRPRFFKSNLQTNVKTCFSRISCTKSHFQYNPMNYTHDIHWPHFWESNCDHRFTHLMNMCCVRCGWGGIDLIYSFI